MVAPRVKGVEVRFEFNDITHNVECIVGIRVGDTIYKCTEIADHQWVMLRGVREVFADLSKKATKRVADMLEKDER